MNKKDKSNNVDFGWCFIVKLIVTTLISLTTLGGFLFFFNEFLDSKIEKKITDTEYIYRLSKTLRPFCIFNKNGLIIYDHGVYNIQIDSIRFKYNTSKKDIQEKNLDEIYIYTKNYLQLAPLLEYIGPNSVVIYKPERIKNNVWLFNFVESTSFISTEDPYDEFFRLEILK